MFNPAMMTPGALPPRKEPTGVTASFDEPPEVKTLQSANKVGQRDCLFHVSGANLRVERLDAM